MTVTFQDVSFRYPNHDTLFSGITFAVAAGEAVAVVGPNGSGKTTILRLIAGVASPTSGSVLPSENCRVVFLPTNIEHFLLPWYSVQKNLAFFNDGTLPENLALIESFFPQFIPNNLSREIFKLSTGEKAIIGYVCALEARPGLLVLDELFGNLSSLLVRKLITEIRHRVAGGLSVVFTSHDPDVVRALASKTISLT